MIILCINIAAHQMLDCFVSILLIVILAHFNNIQFEFQSAEYCQFNNYEVTIC